MNDYTNVVRGAFGGPSAQATAVTSIDDDPEKAARAIKLGEASGESPAVVFGDLENFDKNYRRSLTGGIVGGDEHLSEYATSDPMAAKVSNDDWGQLGAIAERLKRFAFDPLKAGAKGFQEGFGEGPWGSWIKPQDAERVVQSAPWGKGSLVAYQLIGLPIEAAARIFGGAIKGGAEWGREQLEQSGVDPSTAKRFTRDMAAMVEYQLNQTPTAKLAHDTGVPRVATATGRAIELARSPENQLIRQAREAYTIAEPYLKAGKEPPLGLHPLIDDMKKRQSERAQEVLDDIQKEAQKSATRERAPAMFENFVKLRYPNTRIGISADAVAELYKGKMPHAEDGLLGWVPDLEKQMWPAIATGGDIEVPLAAWLARVDPEVAKELHDHIRVRPGGVTKFEAEQAAEVSTRGDPNKALADELKALQKQRADLSRRANEAQDVGDKKLRDELFEQVDALDEQLKQAQARLDEADAREARGGTKFEATEMPKTHAMVEAYHGSPHDFEAFSLEKIGTGEGAQSYGHGLYFAENPAVAETYAIGRQTGKTVSLGTFAGQEITGFDVKPPTKYKVRIHADKEQFLDWDKPLSEQTSQVQEALKKLGIGPDIVTPGMEKPGSSIYQTLVQKGQSEEGLPVFSRGNMEANASRLLKEAGIPGIKYLDQGSRINDLAQERIRTQEVLKETEKYGDPEEIAEAKRFAMEAHQRYEKGLAQQTHNFVLFDDSLIEIIAKNDQVIASTRAASGLPLDYGTGPKPGWEWTLAKEPTKTFWTGDDGVAHEFEFQPMAKTPLAEILKPGREFDVPSSIPLGAIRHRIMEVVGDVPVYLVTNADFARIVPADRLKRTAAFYNEPWKDMPDHIIVPTTTFYSPSIARIIFHEAIHAATSRSLEANPTLKIATEFLRQDVLEKAPHLGEAYGMTNTHEFLAEAITNKNFQKELSFIKVDERLAKALAMEEYKGKSVWQAIVEFIRRALRLPEGEYTALEAALRLTETATKETEQLGSVQPKEAPRAKAAEREPELPGITRQEDLRIFQTITGWMNKTQYERYMELIAKRNQEDAGFQRDRAERILRKQMTQEWKKEAAAVKQEVLGDLYQRPDISALEFLRSGKLYGEETGTRPRINPKNLSEEQLKVIPEKYLRRDGMDPLDVSQLFGYSSFDDFAAHVRALDDVIGNGSLPSHMDKLATQEAERRMLAKHGNLEENILREAQEHVVSDTQMDLLHEEVVALGMKTGSEMTFTKADFKRWVEEQFKGAKADSVSMEKYLKDAGAAGRKVEAALLAEDPTLAFQEKQRQLMAMLLAEQAKKFEKEVERFDKTAKRMSQRVVKGMDQGFVDWTQQLLLQAGEAGKRSALELQEAVARSGFSSLREFVDYHRADGWELTVDEGVLEGNIKPRDQMTVQEFREFKESIDSLTHVGRQIKKINVAGEAMDFDTFKQEVVQNITSLPPRDKNAPVRWIYLLDAELTKMEEIMKDLDLRKELGPLFNAIIRPMAEAKHTEFSMIEKLTKDLKEIKGDFGRKWQKSLHDDIPQDFLTDPFDGALYDMDRQRMINIMLNFGNRSNIEKFTKGYAGKDAAPALEQRLWQLFDQHATKEDWQYVQKIWDLWESWRREADNLYYDLSGVPPKWIEPTPIANRHGSFAGGYFPVIYDRLRSHLNIIEERQPTAKDRGLFRSDYFRATPGNSYIKERTGYIDVVQFDNTLDQTATRMQQTIHDIAFRRQVIEAGKVLYDRDIRAAIRKHYGMEYEKQLDPWLKHTANYFNSDEASLAATNSWLRRARVALITHALGFNLKVIFSPATGHTNPADIVRYMNGDKEVLKQSRELEHTFRNIDRDYREQLEATIKGGRLDQWQAKAMQFGFYPTVKVDQFFRNATFYNEYQKAIHEGMREGDAAAIADAAVRERHGTGAAVDLPRVMRSNEALKMATVFYGFFNTMYNWQRQIPGQLRRGEFAEAAKTGWGALVVPAIFGALLFNQRTQDENVFWTWAKALPLQLMSTLPLARDMANMLIEGQSGRTPWTSFIEAVNSAVNDIRKKAKGKPVPKAVKHTANVVGLGAGLPLGQVGRTGQFSYDVATGAQRPKGIIEWGRGVIHGESKLKRTRN